MARVQSIVISVSVCLSVRSRISKATCSNFTKFYVYGYIYGCGSVFSDDENAIRYVLPVLWMTSCFHIMVHIGYSGSAAMVIDERPATPCMSDIDSPTEGRKRFYWAARRSALIRGGDEVCRLRLPCLPKVTGHVTMKNPFSW